MALASPVRWQVPPVDDILFPDFPRFELPSLCRYIFVLDAF